MDLEHSSLGLTCEWGDDLHLDEHVLLWQHALARGSVVVSAWLRHQREQVGPNWFGLEVCVPLKRALIRRTGDNRWQNSMPVHVKCVKGGKLVTHGDFVQCWVVTRKRTHLAVQW